MPSYNCWTKHGERGVIMEEDEEGDDFIDESYLAHFGDTFMEDAEGEGEGEGEGEEEARDDPVDDLGRTIADARRRCETEKERENLDRMLEDHRKALYPGCDDGLKKLGCTLDLLKWKAQAGVADSAFEDLLKMLKNMFPKNNELPASTYEAKKVVCPLGLEVLKIHACINDCILYRGEYENLNECPVCTALRYKIRGDDPGDDVEGQKPRKKVPAKVMWYAPIIPRLKRLFRNKEHAKLLRWHKEDRKSDGELRHPADGTQWRKIDREFKDFAADARNIRFGLSTDGMNPFGEPKPVFSDEQKKWAKSFLNTSSQAAKNLPDDYERELRAQALTFRRKQEEAEKQEKKALEEAQKKLERGKQQVAQLGEQSKQSIPAHSESRRNPTKEIFSELDEINARVLYFAKLPESQRGTRGEPGAPPWAARPGPWARQPMGGATPWLLRGCPSAYLYSPSRNPITESHDTEILPETPRRQSHLGDSGDRLRHLPERGIITGGLYITMPASGLMRE
ncbi:hypothetical protein QYE76_051408 [Lolium multiflorum]|uniref:Transposon protein, putative, CACTA, En/Spm sub-class n=1 Tax=Lolium multiflorum TaxID=4521 RepID=A0AAD8WI49_LOLMU|nr:hypothetical protein QYE76_051408 [Lolium multiflorum]